MPFGPLCGTASMDRRSGPPSVPGVPVSSGNGPDAAGPPPALSSLNGAQVGGIKGLRPAREVHDQDHEQDDDEDPDDPIARPCDSERQLCLLWGIDLTNANACWPLPPPMLRLSGLPDRRRASRPLRLSPPGGRHTRPVSQLPWRSSRAGRERGGRQGVSGQRYRLGLR
jgi:hypothetical protein